MGESVKTDPQKNSGLTRQELRELESKRKNRCAAACRKGDFVFFPMSAGLLLFQSIC